MGSNSNSNSNSKRSANRGSNHNNDELLLPNNERKTKTISLAEIQDIVRKGFNKSGDDYGNNLLRHVIVRSYDDGRSSKEKKEDDDDTETDTGDGSSIPARAAELVLSFVVTQELCNAFDTLHGGAQATAVDIFTSALLYLQHPVNSVTSDLHLSCTSSAPVGSTILCVCTVLRAGSGLQFASCELYREVQIENNTTPITQQQQQQRRRRILVSKGLHTKYVLKKGRQKGFDGGTPNNTNKNTNTNKAQVFPRSKL